MKAEIKWENILNSNHSHFDIELVVKRIAMKCGYPYYLWNGRVYETISGEDTNVTEQDLE